MRRAGGWRPWWSRCSPGWRPHASTCSRGSMRRGWPRWTNCFARRPWRWRVQRAGINRSAPIITGGRRRRSRGSSKSAVSRTVVRRTRQRLHEYLTRRLEGLEVVALFMDGVVVAGQTVIVALAITRDGGKVPVGLRLGSTENAVLCTELLQDLLSRGLTLEGRVLWVIDGGKGLRKALGDVFGDAAVIQRCQLHKARNLDALVPKARQAYVRASLRRAYRAASAAAARRQLTVLATWLERNGHAEAAASVREGLEDTLTVLKLGLPPTLRRFFATTNCIENLIGTV